MDKHTLTLEHIDPRNGVLVSGLRAPDNEVVADSLYNIKKTNRFVPYRVFEYPAPVTFGDIGEFLVGGEWVICEFGGPEWWEESNQIGYSSLNGGRANGPMMVSEKKGIFSEDFLTSEKRKNKDRRGGEVTHLEGKGIHSEEYRNSEKSKKDKKLSGKSGGESAYKNLSGIHSEEYKNSEKFKEHKRRAAKIATSRLWVSMYDGFISNATGVSSHNHSLKVPRDCRVILPEVYQPRPNL